MIKIAGYESREILYEGEKSLVFRAIDSKNQQPVIIKFLKKEFPDFKEINTYLYEYEMTKKLETIEGVIKFYDFVSINNSKAIIMEDIGGISLRDYLIKSRFSIKDFFMVAIHMVTILGEIHKKNIIHKDIKPHNIIINLGKNKIIIRYIDFALSTSVAKENMGLINVKGLEGTLSYISPELTGRMNRSVDYRSDYYSLGVTLYQMVTGVLPFYSTDPMELIHAHLAKLPDTPTRKVPSIPDIISSIILKLMAKKAEERYQSSQGLLVDLKECLKQYQKNGQITTFPLAEKDISEKFQIPEKIYGREKEVALLLEVFRQIPLGRKEIIYVPGDSGIGKSALINEIHKPVTMQRGFFIEGKYDLLKKDTPYSAIIMALNEMAKQILVQETGIINTWQKQIKKTVGQIGKVITDAVPLFELIIGKQQDVPVLGALESQNRFNMLMLRFFKLFASNTHPLVIFLDDLQWVDTPSLQLLELLLSDDELKHCMFIFSYRDNEMAESHPFRLFQEKIREKHQQNITVISLTELSKNAIEDILVDIFFQNKENVQPLAEVILAKTGGNPFYIQQFLKNLYSDGMIYFRDKWEWELEGIKQITITDNVIDFLIQKLKKLPESYLKCLTFASCSGCHLYIDTLAALMTTSPNKVVKLLINILNEGLLLKTRDQYYFIHDKVQEAAYALLTAKEKSSCHYKIGNYLLNKATTEGNLDLYLITIVNQWNSAVELLTDEEKLRLITLNIKAGNKTKSGGAFQTARTFYQNAYKLLPPDFWQTNYDTAFTLLNALGEAEFLNGRYSEAETYLNKALSKAKTGLEKAETYLLILNKCKAQNRLHEALIIANKALRSLKLSLPRRNFTFYLTIELIKSFFTLKGKTREDIMQLPEATDVKKIAVFKILSEIGILIGMHNEKLVPMLGLKALNLMFKYGKCKYAIAGLNYYALILSFFMGKTEEGYNMGKIALELQKQYDNPVLVTKIQYLSDITQNFLKENVRHYVPRFLEGYHVLLDAGDLDTAGNSLLSYFFYAILSGYQIQELLKEHPKYRYLIFDTLHYGPHMYTYNSQEQILYNLTYKEEDAADFDGKYFNEHTTVKELKRAQNNVLLTVYYVYRIWFYCLFNQYDKAIGMLKKGDAYIQYGTILLIYGSFLLYKGIALTGHYNSVSGAIKKKYLKKLKKIIKKLKKLGEHTSGNYIHKYYLLEAERYRILGDYIPAEDFYVKAINAARDSEYIHEEAVAHELLAFYYLFLRNKRELAAMEMRKARFCYNQWGAKAKVSQINKKYGDLLQSYIQFEYQYTAPKNKIDTTLTPTSSSSSGSGEYQLDIDTVIKASQAISGEFEMPKLLEKMLTILLENAGAHKGGIILFNDKKEPLVEGFKDINTGKTLVLHSQKLDNCMDLSAAIIRYVAKTKESIVLNNAKKEGLFINDNYVVSNNPQSILCIPIIKQNQLIGILYLENNISTDAFTTERIKTLQILSSQIAISIENSRLVKNLKEQERLKQEMEIAEDLQNKLCPPPPHVEGFEISTAMQPAEEVAGDYYDIIIDSDNHMWVVVGDVTGHGLTSGLIMMMCQTLFNSYVNDNSRLRTPKDVINDMNRILYFNIQNRLRLDHFMTICIIKQEDEGSFTFSGAHDEFLVYRKQTGTCQWLLPEGLFMGMLPDISKHLTNNTFELEPGDFFILLTDGILQARNSQGKLFDKTGVEKVVKVNANRSINEIKKAIVENSLAWCGNKQKDDMTMVIVKKK